MYVLNPLNAELNPICCLLALLGAHHFLRVSRIRVKLIDAVTAVLEHHSCTQLSEYSTVHTSCIVQLLLFYTLRFVIEPYSGRQYKLFAGQVMYVWRNTEARSFNHCCSGRATSITYSECVFIALGI